MSKSDNELSKALTLKHKPHGFHQFKTKLMVCNEHGCYCGHIPRFVLFASFKEYTCPTVFSCIDRAKRFISDIMEGHHE